MWIQGVLRHRRLILVAFLLVLLGSLFGLGNLGVNPNNRVFFGPSDPEFSALVSFESEFGTNTSLFFAVSSSRDLTEDNHLVEALRWLSGRLWAIDGVSRVDSLATYPLGIYSEEEIQLTTLLDEYCRAECVSLVPILKPHIVNRFVSADGRTVAVIASVELDTEDSVAVSRIYGAAEDVMEEFHAMFPTLGLELTGGVPMMQAFLDASNSDLKSLVVIAIALFVGLLWIFLRGVWLTTTLVGLGVCSILITMGFAGWFGHTVNTATAITPLVIFTLVIASSMHVLLYVARDPCANREETLRSIERAYSANTRPVLLAAATSVVGLLSLLTVSAPPIRELGILSGIGVIVGTMLLLLVVPCVLSFMRFVKPSSPLRLLQRWLNHVARRVEREVERPFLFGGFFVLCVFFLPVMTVDEDFVRYFGEDSLFRSDTESITARLAGPYHIEVVVDTGTNGGIYEPEVIESVSELARFLRSQGEVANVLSVADVLLEVAKAVDNRTSLEGLDAEALAQFFLSFELSLAKGQSTTDFVDVDHRMVRASVLLSDVSMVGIREIERRIYAWASNNLPPHLRLQVTGEGIPTAHLSSNSIQQLSIGIFFSLLACSILLGVVYRRVRIVGVLLLATTLPVAAGFGLWAVFVGEIGMAATLVVAVTIGVVIDDSIHLLYRFEDGSKELGLSPPEAAGYSILRTGAAIVTTSIVLAGGFSVLMFSDFRMNSTFGICSALVIILALVYNTRFMPRALSWASGATSGRVLLERDQEIHG